MRTSFLMLCCLTLLFTCPCTAQLKERDARKLIEEYLKADTSDNRRKDIEKSLSAADPILCQKPLKGALKNDAQRGLAISLAATVKVPGLSTEIKKYVASEDEDIAVRYLFSVPEGDNLAFLFERWKSVDADTSSFAYLDAGFGQNLIPFQIVEKFVIELGQEKKRESAFRILSYQLGLGDGMTAQDIEEQWASRRVEFEAVCADFKTTGIDVLGASGWQMGVAKKRRAVWVLPKQEFITLKPVPTEWSKGNFTIRFRVFVFSDNATRIELNSEQSDFNADIALEDGKWRIRLSNGQQAELPASYGKWTEINMEFTDKSAKDTPDYWFVRYFVDGKELKIAARDWAFKTKMSAIRFKAGNGEKGVLIGAWELLAKK